MTADAFAHLAKTLSSMPSSTPWTEASAAVFEVAFADTLADDLALTVLRKAILTEQWRPTPARFQELVVEHIASETPAFPSPGDTLTEIRRHVLYHGIRARREAKVSHPLITSVVEQLGGWDAICRMFEGELDKRFPAAFTLCVDERRVEIAKAVQGLPAVEREKHPSIAPPPKNKAIEGGTDAPRPTVILDGASEPAQVAGSVRAFIKDRWAAHESGEIK